jgi:hypothetical protein
MSNQGLRRSFWLSLKTETATWLAAVVIAIGSALAPQITETIKFSINRADLRSRVHENFATDISEYLFYAGLFIDMLDNNLTDMGTLEQVIPDYNRAIVKIKRKEFVYDAQLKTAWNKETAETFQDLLRTIDNFDDGLRGLNPQIQRVKSGESLKIDSNALDQALPKLKSDVTKMSAKSTMMLSKLNPY